jgi:hypothetical protein
MEPSTGVNASKNNLVGVLDKSTLVSGFIIGGVVEYCAGSIKASVQTVFPNEVSRMSGVGAKK